MDVAGDRWKGHNPNSTALPSVMIVIVSKCVRVGERSFGDRQDYVQVREALYGAKPSSCHFFLTFARQHFTHNKHKGDQAKHAHTRQ